MKGHSKLTKESTEKIGSGCRRRKGLMRIGSGSRSRKGLMYSDGCELKEDDPQASAVVAYFKLMTDTLAGLPGGEYNDFLKVMGDFKAGRIDLEGVENQLKDVFRGHAELILGLNRFLPNDSEIILSAESEQADPLPTLITDIHEKKRLFRYQGTLVKDPVSHEQERKTVNQWTPEEKQLFLKKLKIYRNQFSKIASFLENKTTADCVLYFYLNKKSGDLGMFVRRRKELERERKLELKRKLQLKRQLELKRKLEVKRKRAK